MQPEAKETTYLKEPIVRKMGQISRMFMENVNRKLAHLDIDRSYYPLILIEAGNGTLIQKDLARKLSCDKVQVVRIIDYLESNGYVERGQNSNDRRKSNLEITAKAKMYIPEIKKALKETTSIALEDIPESMIDDLDVILKKIENNLSTSNTNE